MPSHWSRPANRAWKRRRSKSTPSRREVSSARFTASRAATAAGLLNEGDGGGDLGRPPPADGRRGPRGRPGRPARPRRRRACPGAWSPGNKLAGLTNGSAVAAAIGNDGSIWHTVHTTRQADHCWPFPDRKPGVSGKAPHGACGAVSLPAEPSRSPRWAIAEPSRRKLLGSPGVGMLESRSGLQRRSRRTAADGASRHAAG